MDQVERLCNNLCLINKGRLVLEGSLNDIRSSYSSKAIEAKFYGNIDESKLKSFFSDYDLKRNKVSGILIKEKNDFLEWMISQVSIESFKVNIPSLEQIFISEVNK